MIRDPCGIDGCLALVRSENETLLREKVDARSRLAYDNVTSLVPGVPEADRDLAAVDAAIAFRKFLTKDEPKLEVALG